MFIVSLSAVLALLHLYVWKRLIKDTTAPGVTRRLLTTGLVALAAVLVFTLVGPRTLDLDEPTWLAWVGYLWFGLAAYLFLMLLVLEPIRLALRRWVRRGAGEEPPVDVSRRVFVARAGAVTASVAAVGVVGVGAATALGPPRVLDVPVRLRRLAAEFDGYRIAVVSDIHLGPLVGRAHTERIVRRINESRPDLVAVVGDLVDGTVAKLGPAAAPLKDLSARDGAFFVTGNHEYFVEDPLEWLNELDRLGVHPLRNENTVLRRGAAALNLAGVNDLSGERHSDAPDFDRALAGLDAAAPTVLLAHQPVQVTTAADRGVDLQLSGHTHGGQMWPFHYAVRAVQPSVAGLSTVEDTQLYVTRGAGFWGPPVRVGAPPDITVVSLRV